MTQQIRTLFDTGNGKGIDRAIEKVITYAAKQEDRLKAEISEYIVTDSIEEQFRKLLERMQRAMEAGAENEIGVWVSGFYGSGKSSFTKYLGFALDTNQKIESQQFLSFLQNRLTKSTTIALLGTVAQRFPATVIMLDLASDMAAGSTMEEISTVLYYKVLEACGYSRNLKIAALERRIEDDKREVEFQDKIQQRIPGIAWEKLRNDPLAIDALIPQLAHDMYPDLFPDRAAFNANTADFFQFETERVREMLDIIRRKTGKEHILFILDEVGQYVAARDNLILNLDGLAKNLKLLGEGKVWVLATAQQTLTEDDPRAVFNSDKLFKLKDRFPIQINLESNDIKEICSRRLLGKSPAGTETLEKLFDRHGQLLRHNTKLSESKAYSFELDRKSFTDLYPFLPAHFDILLNLLSALAKITGGIGLRSAIKVIQDVLVEEHAGCPPVADCEIGWLATTVTIYDAMTKDIEGSFPTIHKAAQKTCSVYADSSLHQDIAKTIAVLQILGNLPATAENITSLIHPSIDAIDRTEAVRAAIDEMMQQKDAGIPLTEVEGSYKFLSDKLLDIEQERSRLIVRSVDARNTINEVLREIFEPLPRVMLAGSAQISCGLKVLSGNSIYSIVGEQHPIQMQLQFSDASEYENEKKAISLTSPERSHQSTIFLLLRRDAEVDTRREEISRCKQIAEKYQGDLDLDIRDYCRNQADRAKKLTVALQRHLSQLLVQGSFVFRGNASAVSTKGSNIAEASKAYLGEVAEQVFHKYARAPVRAETTTAEKFLKQASNPKSITSQIDPLNLVKIIKGQPQIDPNHQAIIGIRDHLDRDGTVNGKQLLDHFSIPPYGWAPDTTRYILAAMLVAGEIVLKVSGREIKAATGQQAIDALKTNKSFGNVGVSLRDSKPSNELLGQAAERLMALTGEDVIPLEQSVSQEAVRCFRELQRDYAPLAERLTNLGVAGGKRLQLLDQVLSDILASEGMDAIPKLGNETSELYDNLMWASALKQSLEKGLDSTVRELKRHRDEIDRLPDRGVPGQLQRNLADLLSSIRQQLQRDDFYLHQADLQTNLSEIQTQIRSSVQEMATELQQQIEDGIEELAQLDEWTQLNEDERNNTLQQLDGLSISEPSLDLAGLKQLLNRGYELNNVVSDRKRKIVAQVRERRQQQLADRQAEIEKTAQETGATMVLKESIELPQVLTSVAQVDRAIAQFRDIREKATLYASIEVEIEIQDSPQQ
jgi:tRNA A37 threonylcarbamoyladenosine biosynthesis protein TsaE